MTRMKILRESMNISMREAASRLGMPYTTYVNYEKGDREPNSEALILLARFFGTTVDYLVGNDFAPVPDQKSLLKITVNDYQKQLLDAADLLNADGQNELLSYAGYLAGRKQYKKSADVSREEA